MTAVEDGHDKPLRVLLVELLTVTTKIDTVLSVTLQRRSGCPHAE